MCFCSESSESTYIGEFATLLEQYHKKEPLQKIFSMTKQAVLILMNLRRRLVMFWHYYTYTIDKWISM